MKKHLLLIIFSAIWMAGTASPFRFIVAADGSGDYTTVQAAIDACPDNERSLIFIKKGTYYGQTAIGSKTSASAKLISLIGENRDSVVLTYDKSLPMVTTFEQATTFQLYAKNFYAENITFVNSAGNTGQALALYTAGDMATFKNCALKGYQDTYRSKKGTRAYFQSCLIEGAVDFVYAGGTVFFHECQINCINGGGYIAAPEDAYVTIPKTETVIGQFIRIGFFFVNCTITRNADVADNSYVLGRPWVSMSGAIYLNCKMDKHIKSAGWQAWSGNETSSFLAEYNSMDLDGNPIDISGRVSWSYQLPQQDVTTLLTTSGIYARVNATVSFDPESLLASIQAPASLQKNAELLSWTPSSNAVGYIVYLNNQFVGYTDQTNYSVNASEETYTVKAIGSIGVLSESTSISTGVVSNSMSDFYISVQNNTLSWPVSAQVEIMNLNGQVVLSNHSFDKTINISSLSSNIYLAKYSLMDGTVITRKFSKKY